MQQVRPAGFYDHGVADLVGGADGLRGTRAQQLARHGDPVLRQHDLRLVLRERPGPHRRDGVCPLRDRLCERRAVHVGERVIIEPRLHRGQAVAHAPEHRRARLLRQHVDVPRLVGRRRSPHDAHRLVRVPLRRVHQVLREPVADGRERTRHRHDQHVDVRVVQDRVEDLRPAFVASRVPAGVDRVRHAEVIGDPLVQLLLRRRGELGEPQPDGRRPIRDVRVRSAGDRIHGDAVTRWPIAPREHRRYLEQLVEPVHPHHAELSEHGVEHRVGARQMPRVRLHPRPPDVASPRLDQNDRHLPLRRAVRRQHERPPVLEPLDVAGDRADVRLLGEVRDDVRRLDIALVSGERPAPQRDPEVLRLVDGPTLVPALRHQRDALSRQVLPERLERVQRGVRTDQPRVGPVDDGLQLPLPRNAFAAHLREPGREDEDEPHLLVDARLQSLLGRGHQHDRHVDVLGNVEHAPIALLAVDLVSVRVHRVDGGAVRSLLLPAPDQPVVQRRSAARRVGRADHRDGPGVEEPVEVELAQRGRAAGHIEALSRHPGRF